MNKKIYVLKSGDNPGIYYDWLSFFENALGQYEVKCKIIIYKTECENQEESVIYSKKWALAAAKEFLEEDLDELSDNITINRRESKTVTEENNDTDIDTDSNDENDVLDISDTEKQLRNMLGIREDLHYGSVWLDLLLQLTGEEKPYISGNRYTGRYSARSLYGMLLYLILEPQMVFMDANLRLDDDSKNDTDSDEKRWYETLQYELFRSEEYKHLKERFKSAGLEKLDINDIKYRVIEQSGELCRQSLISYTSMVDFIRQGNHTIVDLYNELIGNKIYKDELIRISGAMINLELTGKVKFNGQQSSQSYDKVLLEPIVNHTKEIMQKLKSVIIGQDAAIDKLEQAHFHSEKQSDDSMKNGLRSVYLFAGPPGVGKTYMAENFAKALDMPYHRFDMASYSSVNAVEEIIGISSFYKNSKPGVLTSYVRENPGCVLLFDEIEKANIDVIRVFLQILDQGQCFDRYYDQNVSFKDCIIIMTTNAGKQLYNNAGNENLTAIPDRVVIDALEKDVNPNTKVPYFPPEIVSRMASYTIIMFNHLKASAIREVIRNDVEKNLLQNETNYGFDISNGSDVLAATVQYAVGGGGDARNASRLAGKLIDKELYELFSLLEEKSPEGENTGLKRVSWECDFTDCADEISQFYLGERDCIIPILKETDREYLFDVSQKMTIIVSNDKGRFIDIIRSENVLFAVIDYAYGMLESDVCMSITDINTTGSNVFDSVKKEDAYLPVYILKNDMQYCYSDSEKRLLLGKGAEGFIEEDELTKHISQAYSDICCQNAMEILTVRHQVLTYSTRKEISADRTSARIVFYNLKLEMAIDAEDKESLVSDELRPDRKWSDVYVTPDIKNELEFFINYLKNPKEYARTGARVPRGALMLGLPGTGKTSLAKVVASESKVNFLAISADELLNGGPDKVHHIFNVARKYAPAVLFIDEIDAVGMTRNKTGSNSVLNAMLTEMDGFRKLDNKPVFVMAATNMKDIDPALARRFDRTFVVELPDGEGRRWIINKLLLSHKEWFDISNKELDTIVRRSEGLSAAELENIIEMALREGIRNGKPVSDTLLDEMFELHNYGEKREQSSEKEVEHTAYHEAGHAMIQLVYGRCPEYMSVVARSNFNGYVKSERMSEHPTKERMLQEICSCMGGRAAEMEFGYGITPGASKDLQMATGIAISMVCEYGMYEDEIGLAVITQEEYKTDAKAKELVNNILKEQLNTARRIIADNKDVMTRLVEQILHNEQKFLTGKDIMDIYRSKEC